MTILNTAIQAFKKNEFSTALTMFEQAAAIYGEKMVEANIRLCKKALSCQKNEVLGSQASTDSIANTYFDEIYLVNLKKDQKRRLAAAHHLRKNGIKFTLWEATNGYEGAALQRYVKYSERKLGDLNRYPEYRDQEIKRGKPYIESAGAVGYIYTYISILENAKRKGSKRILILEDDVILDRHFEEKLKTFLSGIPAKWKILQLGASQYNWASVDHQTSISAGFYHPRRLDTCGSFAIAIHESIFDEIIEAESAFESPFDHLAMGEIYERHLGSCFVSYPNIVMPDVGTSSIRGQRNQQTHALKMRWPIENFTYPLQAPSIAIFVHNEKNISYLSKFSSEKERGIQIRLYVNTNDGPRPLHNESIFKKTGYQPVKLGRATELPKADFTVKMGHMQILTEPEIARFIESELLQSPTTTSFERIRVTPNHEFKNRVSVIIPTYKRPYNLGKAIDSVIAQEYDDLEIIVVSDNGEDSEFNQETEQIVRQYRDSHRELSIRIINHRVNRNGAAARNTGLLACTGEYVCFLDDDDIYLPRRISAAVDRLKQLPATVGGVYCGFLGWNSPSNDDSRYKVGNLTEDLLRLNFKNHYLHTNTATYRRSALMAINGFDETYRRHQDIELNLRFFDKFSVDCVKISGARLNPEPSAVSNKIFNSDMLELKQKFLSDFEETIKSFPKDVQIEIYRKHWEEVARYTTDHKSTMEHLRSLHSNGAVQLLLQISSKGEKACLT